jgi:hypothetical protein
MHCIKDIKKWILLQIYEMNKWKTRYEVIHGRLGIHMRWLDFKDLELKWEARIDFSFPSYS